MQDEDKERMKQIEEGRESFCLMDQPPIHPIFQFIRCFPIHPIFQFIRCFPIHPILPHGSTAEVQSQFSESRLGEEVSAKDEETEDDSEEVRKRNDASSSKIDKLQENKARLKESEIGDETQLQTEKHHEYNSTKKELLETKEKMKELLQKAESTDEKVAHLQLELKRLEKEVIARDASLQIEKREHEATQKSLVQAKEYSEELLKRNDASSSRIEKLQEDIARLEEKASALEQENNSLLQTGAKLPPNIRGMASQRMSESYDGYSAPESPYNVPRAPMSTTPRGDFYSEDDREQNAFNEQQQESQELLVRSISQYLGFVNGAPVAANLIYKCLLNWKSFEADRTGVLDRIIQKISSAIEDQDNNEMLAYWLSNLSTLVLLLQKIQRASGGPAAGPVPVRRRRMSRTSSSMSGFASNLGGATGSGTNFIQQIIMFLEKLLANIRENLKNELSPLLKLGTQAPKVSRMSSIKGPGQASVSPTGQWHSIVRILDNYMSVLKSNFVPPYIIQRLFTQMFRIMDSELFNSLLLRRESCSFSNGEFLKAGLVELESWCRNSTEEYVGTSYKDLKHIRQAVDFLVALQKPRKTLTEISNDICPSLSTQQFQRLSTMYWDDKYGTNVLSQQVAVDINQMMAREPNSTFMLNEESSPPLTMDDLSRNITVYEMRDSDLPTSIRNHPGFAFLQQRHY